MKNRKNLFLALMFKASAYSKGNIPLHEYDRLIGTLNGIIHNFERYHGGTHI
jgi:hypothetical protein